MALKAWVDCIWSLQVYYYTTPSVFQYRPEFVHSALFKKVCVNRIWPTTCAKICSIQHNALVNCHFNICILTHFLTKSTKCNTFVHKLGNIFWGNNLMLLSELNIQHGKVMWWQLRILQFERISISYWVKDLVMTFHLKHWSCIQWKDYMKSGTVFCLFKKK